MPIEFRMFQGFVNQAKPTMANYKCTRTPLLSSSLITTILELYPPFISLIFFKKIKIMAKSPSTPIHLIVMLLVTYFLCTMGKSNALTCPLPPELATKLHVDPVAIDSASTDYGNIVHSKPAAVLYPSSIEDIQILVNSSYNCPIPFGISVRGNGHSVNGQDMARDGVVVDMKSLREDKNGIKIRVSKNHLFADVGGEQLWIDVLHTTAAQGLSPVSWTDFLYLTVGGTLSNAGISGQTFLHGPQISNVYELDVITGMFPLNIFSLCFSSKK